MPDQTYPTGDKDRDNERFLAAIAYIGIFFVIPLFLARKKSPFLQFHVRQGIVLFVIEALFSAVPFIGWFALAVPAIASLYGMLQALAGRQWELPVLGRYAKKINL
ncbi:MAG TPA: hypothetical protein VL426_07080 [Candidatus Binatia bacterium]|jgi:uncharacterized membrane protein|nr:hypothetical protein [Candidatus Binatia bacterium]